MKVASFFSGIGGFDLGLEAAGMETVFLCEINPFCKKVLVRHWPKVVLKNDINQVVASQIPEADLWCGGFPCQDLSLANQGKRKGLRGDRSGLFFKFAELLEQRLPRWVVLENVPGLLNSNEGEDFQIILKTLDELGYCVAWRILDAKYFGTPQRRRRVFIVASHRNDGAIGVLFAPETFAIDTSESGSEEKTTAERLRASCAAPNLYSIQHASIGRKHSAGPQSKGYRNDGETWTLDSRGSADAICQTANAFRVRKASRLSSRVDSNRYRAIGNAVAVPIIKWLGNRIVQVDQTLG